MGGKEIQKVNPRWPDKQPKHQPLPSHQKISL